MGIQMEREELDKIFIMVSNWKKLFVAMVYTLKHISAL